MNKKYTLSVVVPAYNEEAIIYHNLQNICETISLFCPSYEIIVVNDGSTDCTRSEVLRARKYNSRIKLVTYQKNRGKGGAVKEGIAHARGEYIAFLDADLDLPAEHLEDFLRTMIEADADVVIGSKLHKDSKLNYPLSRRIMSYGYYILLRILFHLDIKDTQTGIKLFRADIIQPIAAELKTTGYAFDIELLIRANQYGFQIIEMPVCLNYTRGADTSATHIRIWDAIDMFFDTLKIYARLKQE
jgi:glycosyltransferase involved in cell wall biosynthesis